MRSHEERIAEVKRRIAEKERQRRQQQERIAAVFGVAACLAVIVGVSLFMPDMVNGAGHILRLWNSGNHAGRQCCAGIYRDRTARLCPWCVCDNRVLPYLPAA